jgi:hypothetical protein
MVAVGIVCGIGVEGETEKETALAMKMRNGMSSNRLTDLTGSIYLLLTSSVSNPAVNVSERRKEGIRILIRAPGLGSQVSDLELAD